MKHFSVLLAALCASIHANAAKMATTDYVTNRVTHATNTLWVASTEAFMPKTDTYTKAETDARIVELAPVPGDYANVSNRAMSAVQPSASNLFPSARYENWEDGNGVYDYPPVGTVVYDSRNGRVYKVIATGWGDGGYPWFPTDSTNYFEDITDSDEVPPTIASATKGLAHTSEIPAIVCAVVTNEVHTFGEWVPAWDPEYYGEVLRFGGPYYGGNGQWDINYRPQKGMAFDQWSVTNGSEYATELIFSGSFGQTNFTLTLTRTHVSENALGLARLPDITNTVTKAYVEGLGIEAGISAATATNIAEDAAAAATAGLLSTETDPEWTAAKGGYATTGTVAQVSEAVGTLWSYVYGDSVWIAVTNYMRTIGGVSPSFQLWEVRNGATNLVYWSKEEITNVTHDLIYDCKTNLEQTVRNAVAEMPDKAWSKYQSATGNEAPDGVTIVSTPTIQLTGGGEWYRYVDVSSNSVWFLKSNGLHTFGGDTNGYFRILDDEGNATFEVRKTDSYLVDAVASSVHFDENGNFCVSFESNIEPVIYTTASLESPNFQPQGDDPNVTVTWTQSGGTYTATLEQTVKGPSLFAYAKVEVQGTTVIRNTAPTDVSGGILCTDGIHKCRPVYSNGSITWEVVP
jgi:hypothetical protein